MNRNDIIEKLQAGVCDITFTKVDGSIRSMEATLSENVIGMEVPETTSNTRQNIYDVSIGAWRSFNWSNLQSVDGEQVEV